MSLDDDILERPVPIDEDRSEHVRIKIRRKLPGRRLDSYLRGRFPHLSRTLIQRLIKQGAIKVNDKAAKASYEICGGDVIDLTIPPPEPQEVVPENIPIDVVYEDDYLIAVNKQTGIICHPARGTQTGTLVNALAYYSNQLSSGAAPFRPGIVHRLDKNTTGIMLVAKTDEAHWRMSLQFERRRIQKTYLAVAEGSVALDGDMINVPIGVHPVVREKFAALIKTIRINPGKEAVTYYEVAERFDGYTLVLLQPKTGRTHQLRVHMSHLGHPLVGDTMYGGRPVSEQTLTGQGSEEPLLEHQALHAWKLEFKHPITDHPMVLEAPLHPPLKRLVNLLREHRSVERGAT